MSETKRIELTVSREVSVSLEVVEILFSRHLDEAVELSLELEKHNEPVDEPLVTGHGLPNIIREVVNPEPVKPKQRKSKHKTSWSETEIRVLIDRMKKGDLSSDIAKQLGRTLGATRGMVSKLRRVGIDLPRNHPTLKNGRKKPNRKKE